jgi:hypothetical protein
VERSRLHDVGNGGGGGGSSSRVCGHPLGFRNLFRPFTGIISFVYQYLRRHIEHFSCFCDPFCISYCHTVGTAGGDVYLSKVRNLSVHYGRTSRLFAYSGSEFRLRLTDPSQGLINHFPARLPQVDSISRAPFPQPYPKLGENPTAKRCSSIDTLLSI